VRDVKRAIASDLGKVGGEEAIIVMIAGGLVEIFLGVFPVPFFTSELGPIIESGSAASDPGVITVESRSVEISWEFF
jgi:hypothetical protein